MSTIINAALCSFGMSGKVFHAPFLEAHPGFHLYAVWERSSKTAKDFYPGIISYSTYADLLRDPNVGLVVVNTPNYTHFDFARQALLAGKAVVVEKPFTITFGEATELAALAEKLNAKLAVYHNRRWDSDFKTVKGVLESGLLGNVVEVELHFDRFRPGLSSKFHKEAPGPGNGVLYDLGPHLIDAALQLFGMPESVFADLRIVRPTSQVIDFMDILLYYPDKRVRLKSSFLVKEPLPAFILHGRSGSFLKHRADVQEEDLQAGKKPGTANWGREPEEAAGILHFVQNGENIRRKVPTEKGSYMEFYNQLYEALTNNSPLPVTAKEAVSVIQIIEAAIQSNDLQKRIKLTSL